MYSKEWQIGEQSYTNLRDNWYKAATKYILESILIEPNGTTEFDLHMCSHHHEIQVGSDNLSAQIPFKIKNKKVSTRESGS